MTTTLEHGAPAGAFTHLNERGELDFYMIRDPDSHSEHTFTGVAYEVTAWEDAACKIPYEATEVAKIYLKRDGCAHVGFRDPELDNEWVHVCGQTSMEQSLKMLRWMWVVAQKQIPGYVQTEILRA